MSSSIPVAEGSGAMLDLVYVVVTAAFFVVMLSYVAACRAVGRRAEHRERGA